MSIIEVHWRAHLSYTSVQSLLLVSSWLFNLGKLAILAHTFACSAFESKMWQFKIKKVFMNARWGASTTNHRLLFRNLLRNQNEKNVQKNNKSVDRNYKLFSHLIMYLMVLLPNHFMRYSLIAQAWCVWSLGFMCYHWSHAYSWIFFS